MNTQVCIDTKVYLWRFDGHNWNYSPAIITKVTPSGAFSAVFECNSAMNPMRFTKDGKEIGATYRGWELDTHMSFEARKASLEQDARMKKAAHAISGITVSNGVNDRWGKDGLLAEVVRLEALVAAARAKVEAI